MRLLGSSLRRRLIAAVATGGFVVAAAGSVVAQTVTTPGGLFPSTTYQGTAGNGITTFLGVRFAAPPTGALRFAPPVAPAPASGTVAATSFANPCPQNASPFGTASADEDCLFLNVYVPGASVSSSNSLPVMVFFYGGAFVSGEGSLYDATNLATAGNTIVVTINYRLGILGYMADAALSAESASGVSGNYGLADQQLALQWVQQNIAAFGGNPQNVTIFGGSAGALSVCANIVSPAAAGLFQRAISQSGPCGVSPPTLAGAETQGATIVSSLGCNAATNAATVACLRSVSVSDILAVQNEITAAANLASPGAFGPNVDGVLIPLLPAEALISGQYNHVPVIEGTNHDEGRLFVALLFDLNAEAGPLTAAGYPAAVQSVAAALVAAESGLPSSTNPSLLNQLQVRDIAAQIEAEYPLHRFSSPDVALAAILSDGIFSCTANISNEVLSLGVPTFAYEFNDENAPMLFLPAASFPYGATHTDELQFLFAFPSLAAQPLSADEQMLAATMTSYWTTFAASGNPNSSTTPAWAAFTIAADDVQSLLPPTPAVEFDFATEHHCSFWAVILEETIFAGIADALTAAGITD
jgi:para-nitrobenzyl esterase